MDGRQQSSDLTIVDGDGHVVEPPDLWESRMDAPRWGDWIPHVDLEEGTIYVGGEVRGGGRESLERVSALSGIPVSDLERMDEQVKAFGLDARWLSMAPSEYFRRQCHVSFDPGEWNLAASARHIGVDRILWASDYPHPEYRPGVVDEPIGGIATLEPDEQARIAGTNAIEAYHLPVAVGA